MQSLETIIQHHAPNRDEKPIISEWFELDQARITQFGLTTADPDPLHIDPDYAARYSPYGSTIAYGFLTISLLTHLYRQSLEGRVSGYALNYGFERLRLPQVVKVGDSIRGVFRFIGGEDRGAGKTLLRYDVTVEIKGEDKPALVAEWLTMWIDDGVDRPDEIEQADSH